MCTLEKYLIEALVVARGEVGDRRDEADWQGESTGPVRECTKVRSAC